MRRAGGRGAHRRRETERIWEGREEGVRVRKRRKKKRSPILISPEWKRGEEARFKGEITDMEERITAAAMRISLWRLLILSSCSLRWARLMQRPAAWSSNDVSLLQGHSQTKSSPPACPLTPSSAGIPSPLSQSTLLYLTSLLWEANPHLTSRFQPRFHQPKAEPWCFCLTHPAPLLPLEHQWGQLYSLHCPQLPPSPHWFLLLPPATTRETGGHCVVTRCSLNS